MINSLESCDFGYGRLKKVGETMSKALVRGFCWFLVVLLGLGIGCKGRTLWSTKDEVRIGHQIATQVEKEYALDPNPEHQQRVQLIGQRLMAIAGKKEYRYSFKVLDEKEINAISLPGGPVYVLRGLLEMVGDDDDMLASVIAHEVGHINARHLAKQYTKSFWTNLVIAFGTKGRTQDYASIGAVLLELHYSRKDEYEADRLAVEYAYKAGYDPNGLVRFFDRLRSKQKSEPKGILANLRTHPLTENRIKHAQEQITKVTGSASPAESKGGTSLGATTGRN